MVGVFSLQDGSSICENSSCKTSETLPSDVSMQTGARGSGFQLGAR